MKIELASNKTIGEIQAAFSGYFPNLKLAFFSKSHKAYKSSAAKFLIQEKDMPLSKLSSLLQEPKSLLLEQNMPVWQLERLFEEECGLHVQVFRRSGKIWLETSKTDDLTLEQQEAKALSSDNIHTEFGDPIDYREQD
jgi:hypothetical protein